MDGSANHGCCRACCIVIRPAGCFSNRREMKLMPKISELLGQRDPMSLTVCTDSDVFEKSDVELLSESGLDSFLPSARMQ